MKPHTQPRERAAPPRPHAHAEHGRHALPHAVPIADVGLARREDLHDALVVRCPPPIPARSCQRLDFKRYVVGGGVSLSLSQLTRLDVYGQALLHFGRAARPKDVRRLRHRHVAQHVAARAPLGPEGAPALHVRFVGPEHDDEVVVAAWGCRRGVRC